MYVIVYYLRSVLKYAVFGSGPLTVLGGVEVGENLYILFLGGVFNSLYCQIYFELIVRVDVCSQGLAWVPTKFTNKSKDWPGCSFISASALPMTPCPSP